MSAAGFLAQVPWLQFPVLVGFDAGRDDLPVLGARI